MNFEDLNKGCSTLRNDVDLGAMEFINLGQLEGQTLHLDGFYFSNAGKFGKQVVVVADGYKINMPKRYVETFETIEASEELIAKMLLGNVLLTDIKNISTRNGATAVFSFKEIEPKEMPF